MITLKDIYSFIKELLGHPVFKFIYPFIIGGIMILIVRDGKSLSYLITDSKELNSFSKDQVKEMNGSLKGKMFQDKIAIFNDGNEIVDNDDFINVNQICLSKNGSLIKKIEVCKRNRNSLVFDFLIDSLNASRFYINLKNKEVFEVNDVVVMSILYEQHKIQDWSVESRIKGIPKGIRVSDLKSNERNIINWVTIILIILTIIFIYRAILFKKYNKKFIFRNVELYSILTFLGIAGVLYYEYFQDVRILEYLFN